ncbi:bifunctional diguanylate cyclase/phosphodiesterase [Dechloromonas sp. HYN0024]|uniref:putative bifunctional diguanylate cyclase/phosphodiesterase n=1 Tax=Dechloromonas sp. HYN0024 TaxID=2231055 RepID=UPI000E439AA7|nr:GGDEF and EAL domain-containing protein [Dechloromonas sp. HYN0024]AXS80246.1 EAL domain-containing protein [Dechloromonas sp. HYN0024]
MSQVTIENIAAVKINRKRLLMIAALSILLTGMGLPLVVLFIQYNDLSDRAQQLANTQAVLVGRYANWNPDGWQFKPEHIEVSLKGIRPEDTRTVIEKDGAPVMVIGEPVPGMTLERQQAFSVYGNTAGQVRVIHGLGTLPLIALLSLILGSTLCGTLYWLLRKFVIGPLNQAERMRRLSEERLAESNKHFSEVIESIPDAIFLKDAESRWLVTNEPAKQLFQLHDIPWQGKTEMELAELHPEFRAAHEACLIDDQKAWDSGKLTIFAETVVDEDGTPHDFEVRKVPIYDDQHQRRGLVIIGRDISERKQAEAKINELAFFDQLTGLPNRTLLLDRLKQIMTASSRSGNHGALLLIDLDKFKTLNDTLGHDMGNLLLQQVASRLTDCVRAGDTVARLGGDEFVVMLTNLSGNATDAASQTEVVGEKILTTLRQTYQLRSIPYHSTPSIGVSLFSGEEMAIDDLMKQADLAMYKSKEAGRNALRFFDLDMERVVIKRAALEHDLHEAIEKKQFLLHYQAQLAGGRLTGAEALVRWQHPQRGMVSPAEFIQLAEETGLILPLGHWVLETACTQLAIWADRPEMTHLTVAVNVSAQQFHQSDFVDQVLEVLRKTGANPQRLKLELTESLLVANVNEIIEKMFALKSKGVCFSLDDFGTGYSSLSYLKRLPLDQLKIDQSFVRDVLIDPNDAAIARTVIALAQNLGLGVIAEGVETEAQRDFLASAGCHAYQGYFFSRPLPPDGFEIFASQA